jgi:hypothetical protein
VLCVGFWEYPPVLLVREDSDGHCGNVFMYDNEHGLFLE